MESLEDTPEVGSNECEKKEEEASTAIGSCIKERQSSLEYLDLQVEKPNQKRPDQSDDLLEGSKINKISNSPIPSSGKCDVGDITPPGTDELKDQSFDNALSDMYSCDNDAGDSSSSNLKRTINDANFNDPENKFLTLDEIEERKKLKLKDSRSTISSSTIR